ncbi:type II secretion system protein [Persicirhabdus sediminis]|uniref:Uncharacterized protein n=1 Tax=Persicirhabdus sediminis TaxID=454144 RepID=A0A8J7SHD7_9BACT|nr:type II secretion system protein [Persicirhabdus sediminis]MBK1789776.1 hypothetical protein [Persicirhabdus sediminis]
MRTNLASRPYLMQSEMGFALIATIAVMALMAVTALAMLSLSTVEVRSSNHGDAMAEAKANARMALMIAIGELQKAAGPDTRVTAEGNIDDQADEGKGHWMGVWSSAKETGSQDAKDQGEFISWMVSHPPNTPLAYSHISDQSFLDDTFANGLANSVTLVGAGSANINDKPGDKVIAPKVEIIDSSTENRTGHYAYWIGDEGVKARIDLQSTEGRNDRLTNMGTQRSAFEVMTDIKESKSDLSVDDPQISKLLSTQSIAHMSNREAGISHFHDITSHSMGLQTTTRDANTKYGSGTTTVMENGGLKIDLSLLFEKSDNDFEALTPADYAAFQYDDAPFGTSTLRDVGLLFTVDGVTEDNSTEGMIYGPTMDMLRTHYRLYKDVENKESQPTLKQAFPFYPNATEFDNNYELTAYINAERLGRRFLDTNTHRVSEKKAEDGNYAVTFDVTRNTKPNVAPYLNRVLYYFSVITEKTKRTDGSGGSDTHNDTDDECYRISKVVITPIVILHNPYDISINCPDMAYRPHFQESQLLAPQGGSIKLHEEKLVTNGNTEDAVFKIPACSYKPGEIKLFMPNDLKALENEHELAELSTGVSLGSGAFFEIKKPDDVAEGDKSSTYMETQNIDANDQFKLFAYHTKHNIQSLEIYQGGNLNRIYTSRAVNLESHSTGGLSSLRNGAPERSALDYATAENEPLQATNYYDFYTKPYNYELPRDYMDSESSAAAVYGFPTFVFNNPMCVSDSGIDNKASGNITRQASPGASVYSPYKSTHADYSGSAARQEQITALLSPDGKTTTWGSGYNDEGQTHISVLSIPTAPLVSIGSLQHANLFDQGNHPALLIGNSFPNLQLTDLAITFEEISRVDNNGYRKCHIPFDSTFHTNEAIWDYYYFSSIAPRSDQGAYDDSSADAEADIQQVISDWLDGTQPLANERIVFLANGESIDDVKLALAEPEAYQFASAYTGLLGAFNVNSTSVEAWKAMLAGYRGQSLDINPNGKVKTHDNDTDSALPRTLLPNKAGISDPEPFDEDTWLAFAKLSDDDIQELAEAIVTELKERMEENAQRFTAAKGSSKVPFLSLADFVNRMPDSSEPEYQTSGLLQGAIHKAKINETLETDSASRTTNAFTTAAVTPNARDYEVELPEDFPALDAASSPSYILQSDILQAIGSSISARSDTFKIRAYGDSLDSKGNIVAEAWCEAVVQRTPVPVTPVGTTGIAKWTPDTSNSTLPNYGRKMKVVAFKWLNKNEI